jgi:hypothetical protein
MEKVEIIEKWYPKRVERYVRNRSGELVLLDIQSFGASPFLEWDLGNASVGMPEGSTTTGGTATSVTALCIRR